MNLEIKQQIEQNGSVLLKNLEKLKARWMILMNQLRKPRTNYTPMTSQQKWATVKRSRSHDYLFMISFNNRANYLFIYSFCDLSIQ